MGWNPTVLLTRLLSRIFFFFSNVFSTDVPPQKSALLRTIRSINACEEPIWRARNLFRNSKDRSHLKSIKRYISYVKTYPDVSHIPKYFPTSFNAKMCFGNFAIFGNENVYRYAHIGVVGISYFNARESSFFLSAKALCVFVPIIDFINFFFYYFETYE